VGEGERVRASVSHTSGGGAARSLGHQARRTQGIATATWSGLVRQAKNHTNKHLTQQENDVNEWPVRACPRREETSTAGECRQG
jgi:hypothetical protein